MLRWLSRRLRSERQAQPNSPRLEIHVAISPNPLFVNRMHYLAASLKVYGEQLAGSPLIITVGADCDPVPTAELAPWAGKYPNVEFRWLDRALYTKYSYWATRHQRCCYPFSSEVVLLLDPDVLFVGAFDELIEQALTGNALTGCTAHVTPIRGDFTWQRLFECAGLSTPRLQCEHSGFGLNFHDASNRYCPPYFNLGVLAAPAHHWRTLASTLFQELDIVWPIEDFYRAQTSLALAIERHQIPWQLMNLKYNFPNDLAFLDRYRDEFEDMRLVHYLRKDQFDKDETWETPSRIAEQIERDDLHAVNRAFMDRLRPIHQQVLEDLDSWSRPTE